LFIYFILILHSLISLFSFFHHIFSSKLYQVELKWIVILYLFILIHSILIHISFIINFPIFLLNYIIFVIEMMIIIIFLDFSLKNVIALMLFSFTFT
jgi:hypothetical protein